MNFVSDEYFKEGGLKSNISVTARKSNYGDIFSFLNKLKFYNGKICTKLLIQEQKIINICQSDTLVFLKSYF